MAKPVIIIKQGQNYSGEWYWAVIVLNKKTVFSSKEYTQLAKLKSMLKNMGFKIYQEVYNDKQKKWKNILIN